MQTKQFSIRLDMQQALPFHPFEVIEGDTGNVVEITLENNGEAVLLNDCAIVVAFTSSMGFAMQDATSGVTIGDEAGVFSVLLDPDSYGPGNVSADVQVYSGPGNRVLVTSTRFDFRCKRSLISEEIIRANAAYPPLISATLACEQATAAANAAVASIDTSLGELNVQADWTETDSESDAYILHKPQTPFDLGAPEEIHAYQHAKDGDDPITPNAIGAAATANATVVLTAAGWTGDAAPFTQTASVAGAAASHCDVIVAPAAADREAYADYGLACAGQGSGTLTFCCEEKPIMDISVHALLVYDGGATEA